MVLPLIPILIGTGIRLAAPAVAKFLMKKGFQKASQKALKKAGSNVKSISKNQATKLKPPSTTKLPKPKTTKVKVDSKTKVIKPKTTKKVEPKKTTKEFYEKAGFKKSDGKPKQLKFQPKKTTKEFYEKAGFKKPSGKVPAKLKKLPVADQQKIARLGGLSGVKKLGRSANPALWKKLIGAGLLAGSVAVPLITGSKKTADATLKNKKRKSKQQISGEGEIAAGIKASGVKGPAKPKSTVTAAEQKAADSFPQGMGRSLSKQEKAFADSRGGLKAFAPGKIEKGLATLGGGKMRGAVTALEDSYYSDIKDRMSEEGGEVSEYEKNYVKNFSTITNRKAKGGMVKRKYGGKIKRNMGGPAKPRKKTVFRRGGGQALRGFGKATYSNKMY